MVHVVRSGEAAKFSGIATSHSRSNQPSRCTVVRRPAKALFGCGSWTGPVCRTDEYFP
jgi:hypothetical protein